MDELREQSARLARDLARLSIDLREELAKAVDAVRLAQVSNGNGHAEGNGNGHSDEPYADTMATVLEQVEVEPVEVEPVEVEQVEVEPVEVEQVEVESVELEVIDLTEVRHTYP